MHIGRSAGPLAYRCWPAHDRRHQPRTAARRITTITRPARSRSHTSRPREESALVSAVRDATARFRNVTSLDGPGEGYALNFGCVSGGDFGAMGLHYVNMNFVDGNVNVKEPEIILFEPPANGGIRITGVDFLCP